MVKLSSFLNIDRNEYTDVQRRQGCYIQLEKNLNFCRPKLHYYETIEHILHRNPNKNQGIFSKEIREVFSKKFREVFSKNFGKKKKKKKLN